VFNHASSWFVLAGIMNGNVEDAYRIYNKMLPVNSSAAVGINNYETEPYVYSEYVTSREHETEGQASHSWLTGSSVWMYRIGLDWILGLRTSLLGIKVDPNIPKEWDKLEITRKYRGKTLNITIDNSAGVNHGVKKQTINGKDFIGDWIDVEKYDGDELLVEVVMG
jgi:cellobiose phosphorylase